MATTKKRNLRKPPRGKGAELIRKCAKETGKKSPSAVAATMRKRGYKVSPSHVSAAMHTGGSGGSIHRRRRSGAGGGGKPDGRGRKKIDLTKLAELRKFVEKFGGIKNVERGLNMLNDLQL